MFKNKASYTFPIGERVYQFLLDNDSPLPEVIQVLDKIKSDVEAIIAAAEEKKKSEE